MEEEKNMTSLSGFSPASSTPVYWKSRKRSSARGGKSSEDKVDALDVDKPQESSPLDKEPIDLSTLSEKRKALFEPLDPTINTNAKRPWAESASYPKGWLIGKKRKLVNIDVVESMRRIAVQEMNRKDREIDGLNEQLEEDSRCLEHLQLQLLDERSKRAEVQRQNNLLKNQITLLMDMLQQTDAIDQDHVA